MWKLLIGTALFTMFLAPPVLAIDLDEVYDMLKAGVGEEVILKAIDTDRAEFVLTSEDLINLKQAGASNWFLDEMLNRSGKPVPVEETAYRVVEPSYSLGIGFAYDPFDYYFAAWPYYYSYYSPYSFCWNWWYYGGPYHDDWCDPYCYRNDYYCDNWGTGTIWDRGWHGGDNHHVPYYGSGGKEQRSPYSQASYSGSTQGSRSGAPGMSGEKPERSGSVNGSRTGARPERTATWGRPDRQSSTPSRSSTHAPRESRPGVRSSAPRSTNAPPHSAPSVRSGSGGRSGSPPRSAYSYSSRSGGRSSAASYRSGGGRSSAASFRSGGGRASAPSRPSSGGHGSASGHGRSR
jgi:hypothetical protein